MGISKETINTFPYYVNMVYNTVRIQTIHIIKQLSPPNERSRISMTPIIAHDCRGLKLFDGHICVAKYNHKKDICQVCQYLFTI